MRALLALLLLPSAFAETLHYNVEWRMIRAADATLEISKTETARTAHLHLWTIGLVSRLFKVNDEYSTTLTDKYCALSTRLLSEENDKRRETNVTWSNGTSRYLEVDRAKNNAVILERTLPAPGCVSDVIGAMLKMRTLHLDPGQSTSIPVSDGKKLVQARVEAQERETIKTATASHQCTKYEAFLFNDVLFKRNARLFIWISDDARRLPVQIQVRMRIHIGTVTFTLDKAEP